MAPSAAAPSAPFLPEGLLLDLLAVSLTGVYVLYPVYAPPNELADFAIAYLNPVGQRMLGLAERPGGTLLTRFPPAIAAGILGYCQRAYEAGPTDSYEAAYQTDELAAYYRLAARRSGEWLVVSFTDTSSHSRSAVETALRESQAREQAAHQEAETQRLRLHQVLMKMPASIALLTGPDHVYELVNPNYEQLFPARIPLGRPLREVIPELAGQGFYELFDRVYETGEPFYEEETEAWADFHNTGQLERRYYRTSFQPIYNAQGKVTEVLNFAVDITAQVAARRQVEQLNQALEARVQERTRELRYQQGLLTQIMQQVPAAIATLSGAEHRHTFFNDTYQLLAGGRTQLGLPMAEVFPEIVAQGFIGLLDQVYSTGQPSIGTETPAQFLSSATGQPELHYLDFIYQPLLDDQDQTTGILAFIVDVTAKVRAQQQTQALQAQLLAAAQQQAAERLAFFHIFEQTPAFVALLRAPGHRYEYVNPACQAFFPGRQLVGRNVADAVPELQEQGFVALLDRVYQSGETYFGQEMPFTPLPTPGHPPRTGYFNFTFQVYREQGEVAGVTILAYDVTEQVLTRQEREASARQLHLITDALPVLISYVDRTQHYQFTNQAYQPWFGLTPAQLLGRPIWEVAGAAAYPIIQPYIKRALAGERVDFEARMPFRPDFVKHIRTSYIPDVQQGVVQGFYALVSDVTEQVETRQQVETLNQELATINEELTATNEELHNSNRQLTRTNVDLDNFIYTASHDLKQPISNIEGLLLALEHELPAASRVGDVALMLTMMQGAVERFTRTIAHLTDLSRLQKEHAQPSQPVALAAVVEAVRLDLLPLLHDTQAKLTVDIPASITLTFSEKNLRSVVYNLLSNALKYHHPDRPPHVQLRYRLQSDYQVLEVQDNGLGLDLSQDYDKLFAMFQRLHTHVEGTGIGLHMVKKMVENAGGYLEVESQFGQGTTFRVYFLR